MLIYLVLLICWSQSSVPPAYLAGAITPNTLLPQLLWWALNCVCLYQVSEASGFTGCLLSSPFFFQGGNMQLGNCRTDRRSGLLSNSLMLFFRSDVALGSLSGVSAMYIKSSGLAEDWKLGDISVVCCTTLASYFNLLNFHFLCWLYFKKNEGWDRASTFLCS